MPRRPKLLNVRQHLEHGQTIIDGLAKYGLCTALQDELKVWSFVNRAIIRQHDERRTHGDRKDLYITRTNGGQQP